MEMEEPKTPLRINQIIQEVHIPASPFMEKIGSGTGVAVYKMQRSSVFQSPWAVKKLIRKQKHNVELDKRLGEEAEVLRQLHHPNIVEFRAFVKDSEGKNVLAMEECSSCLGEMTEERNDSFPAKIILKVCSDIANALEYLHNKALLIHCDIKSYNILIKGDFSVCKLCDFGVCLPVTKTGDLDLDKCGEDAEYIGTAAWCAPEVLKYPQEITTKADIYSYGLVIWEMIALVPPVDENFTNSFAELSVETNESDDASEIQDPIRTRPPLPDIELGAEYNQVLEIFYCCTDDVKRNRPSANTLIMILDRIYKDALSK